MEKLPTFGKRLEDSLTKITTCRIGQKWLDHTSAQCHHVVIWLFLFIYGNLTSCGNNICRAPSKIIFVWKRMVAHL
ncbi:hypothetical protein ACHAW5_006850 [Stephanodiscus triporus]|uniref:Uncharacterized protein n=1 Tax=Stephanodiscus triporus TaxID=2934178 RepID=A0ABD3PY24_9STRA